MSLLSGCVPLVPKIASVGYIFPSRSRGKHVCALFNVSSSVQKGESLGYMFFHKTSTKTKENQLPKKAYFGEVSSPGNSSGLDLALVQAASLQCPLPPNNRTRKKAICCAHARPCPPPSLNPVPGLNPESPGLSLSLPGPIKRESTSFRHVPSKKTGEEKGAERASPVRLSEFSDFRPGKVNERTLTLSSLSSLFFFRNFESRGKRPPHSPPA